MIKFYEIPKKIINIFFHKNGDQSVSLLMTIQPVNIWYIFENTFYNLNSEWWYQSFLWLKVIGKPKWMIKVLPMTWFSFNSSHAILYFWSITAIFAMALVERIISSPMARSESCRYPGPDESRSSVCMRWNLLLGVYFENYSNYAPRSRLQRTKLRKAREVSLRINCKKIKSLLCF